MGRTAMDMHEQRNELFEHNAGDACAGERGMGRYRYCSVERGFPFFLFSFFFFFFFYDCGTHAHSREGGGGGQTNPGTMTTTYAFLSPSH